MPLPDRLMAAYRAYRDYGRDATLSASAQDAHYALLGAFYAGAWAADKRWSAMPGDVYRNARQIVKHTSAIVDCYQQLVYSGDLPVPAEEGLAALPEGIPNAIPIKPRTRSDADDQALLRAIFTGFDVWKFRSTMQLIPKTAAIFGDLLVVLIDDTRKRGAVVPELVNPWNVPPDGLELDSSGNIRAVAIQYRVNIPASTAFGRTVEEQHYLYRKEITPEEFRYYKDEKAWSAPEGHGNAVQPNPYGFVPACWFRHEIVSGSDRGMGAYEKTLLPAMEINSLFSAAIDYQRKQFGAPIGVKGSALRPGRTLTMPGGVTLSATATETDIERARRQYVQSLGLLPLDESGDFVTINFDIGQTRELLAFLDDNMIAENPEAKYAQLLAELRQATGPGVAMTLRPITAKVQSAQGNHDPQILKLVQMFVSMMGFRLNSGAIPSTIVAGRKDRYDAFRPYTLDSFGQGKLDADLPVRDPFPESKLERAQWVQMVDTMTPWGKRTMGVPDEEITQSLEEQRSVEASATVDFARAFNAGSI